MIRSCIKNTCMIRFQTCRIMNSIMIGKYEYMFAQNEGIIKCINVYFVAIHAIWMSNYAA